MSKKERAVFKKFGAAGGRTAAENMTTEQKRARALKAVAAREAKRRLKAREQKRKERG